MATRCTDKKCAYGYGHHAEHVRAAKLGWRSRRVTYKENLSYAFRGYQVEKHKGKVILRNAEDGSHFHLDEKEARQIVREVKTAKKLEAAEKIKDERHRNRAIAAYQRQAERENRELLISAIKNVAPYGIRNYNKDASGKRILQEDVWANIPKSLRAKGDIGLPPDEAASDLAESYPYLGIHTDSDLAQALEALKRRKVRHLGRRSG